MNSVIEKISKDPEIYIKKFLKIVDKKQKLVPFKFNYVQEEYYKSVKERLEKGIPIRDIILKARQEGLSTFIQGLIFTRAITTPYTTARIVAHEKDGSEHLFAMANTFYNNLPEDVRPMTKYSNKKELVFENPDRKTRVSNPGLCSRLAIDIAKSVDTGRSATVHCLHASEVAFYPGNANVLMGSLLQTVPNEPGTMVFLESTGNAYGDYFYKEYFKAKAGESVFKSFFFPWYVHEEYQTPLTEAETKSFPLSSKEKELVSKYGLLLEQIKWYRNKVKEFDSIELFQREYPTTEEEAFISAGRPAFNMQRLGLLSKTVRPPIKIGYVLKELGEIKIVTDERGDISVWEEPNFNLHYVIGADTAEGDEGGDWNVGKVLCVETLTEVAELRNRNEPDIFSKSLGLLGIYYGTGLMGVESNNHGHTVLNELKKYYPNIYFRQIYDEMTNVWKKKIGWNSNRRTKPLMIDDLGAAIRKLELHTFNSGTISECMTYQKEPDGKTNAVPGCFDDRVMALAVAIQMAYTGGYDGFYVDDELAEYGQMDAVVPDEYEGLSWEDM